MELWIRSQDEKTLANIKNVYIVESDNEEKAVICGYTSDEFNDYDLGSYDTVMRALQVLDEIENFLLCKIDFKYSGDCQINELTNLYVYDMPEK